MFVITADDPKPQINHKRRAALLSTLIAYIGRYRLEGDRWITNVEGAWNPEWVASEQEGFFRLDGNRLEVAAPWRIMPHWPEKGLTRSVLTFERPE